MAGHPQHGQALIGPPGGDLQQIGVGEGDIIGLRPLGLQVGLGLVEHRRVRVLEDDLDPGDRHLLNGLGPAGEVAPGQVALGDLVGAENIDLVLMIGLKPHLGKGRADLGQVDGRLGGKVFQPQALLRGKVIDGGPVGQDHRGIHRQALPLHLNGKVDVGPAGGDAEQAPFRHKAGNGLAVFLGNGTVTAVQGVVIIRGQQNAGKLSHGGSSLRSFFE